MQWPKRKPSSIDRIKNTKKKKTLQEISIKYSVVYSECHEFPSNLYEKSSKIKVAILNVPNNTIIKEKHLFLFEIYWK